MANSSTVTAGTDILATEYNNLRLDVLSSTVGHDHQGTDGKLLTLAAIPSITATAAEINQALDGISANVTFTNLNTLTAGQASAATLLHHHDDVLDTQFVATLAGGAEQTLLSATVPANVLSTKHGLRVFLHLSHVGVSNGDDLVVRVKFGGSTIDTITCTGTTGTTNRLMGEWVMVNTATNAQKFSQNIVQYNQTPAIDAIKAGTGTAAVDTTSSQTFELTAQADEVDNDLNIVCCLVEYIYVV